MLTNNFLYAYQILPVNQNRSCVFLLMFPKYYPQILYSDIVYGTIFGVNIYLNFKEELSTNYHELFAQRV